MKKLLTFENLLIIISAIILTIVLFLPSKVLTGCPYGKTVDLAPGGSCPYFVPGQNNLCALAIQQATKTVTTFDFSSWLPLVVFLILISLSILILFSKSFPTFTSEESLGMNPRDESSGHLRGVAKPCTVWCRAERLLGGVDLKTEGRLLVLTFSFVFFYFFFSKLCPISTFQAIFLQKELIAAKIFVFLFFLIPLFLSLLFSRLFCGFICPIGAIQEIFFRIPRCQLPHLKFFKIPKILLILPFLVLAVLPILVYKFKSPIFCKFDPFSFLFCKNYSLLFLLFTVCCLLFAVFIFRPFCQLFCPYGAILKILSKFSLFGLKIEKKKCKNCKICEKICPVDAIKNGEIITGNCFLCADCQKPCQSKAIKLYPLTK